MRGIRLSFCQRLFQRFMRFLNTVCKPLPIAMKKAF